MSLLQELQQTMAHIRSVASAAVVEALDTVVERLHGTGVAERGAAVGDHPALPVLPDTQGNHVDLAALNADGPLVISFYRGGWCPYCNVEVRALQRIHADLLAHGATLVAITPDLPDHGATTAAEAGIDFPVLHDAGLAFARALGIVFTPDATLRELNQGFGLDLMARNGSDNDDLPMPATFVLDASGKIVWAFKSADWKLRAEPADILAAVAAA